MNRHKADVAVAKVQSSDHTDQMVAICQAGVTCMTLLGICHSPAGPLKTACLLPVNSERAICLSLVGSNILNHARRTRRICHPACAAGQVHFRHCNEHWEHVWSSAGLSNTRPVQEIWLPSLAVPSQRRPWHACLQGTEDGDPMDTEAGDSDIDQEEEGENAQQVEMAAARNLRGILDPHDHPCSHAYGGCRPLTSR